MVIFDFAREVAEMPLVMAWFFEKPKCKPWDLVKGKRFACCHYLKESGHSRWCLEGVKGKVITIPKFSSVSARDLI